VETPGAGEIREDSRVHQVGENVPVEQLGRQRRTVSSLLEVRAQLGADRVEVDRRQRLEARGQIRGSTLEHDLAQPLGKTAGRYTDLAGEEAHDRLGKLQLSAALQQLLGGEVVGE